MDLNADITTSGSWHIMLLETLAVCSMSAVS